MAFLKKNSVLLLLTGLILVGAFFRLYDINWGAPYYFHPDERNIASAITQLSFPHQMNPQFFAYGSLPIYVIYFLGLLQTGFHFSTHISFSSAILLGRLASALLSLGMIPLCFIVGEKLFKKEVGLLAAALMTVSTGLIQYSHFGTFEVWLTFFGLLFFSVSLDVLKRPAVKNTLFLGIICGVLLSIKVTSVIFIPLGILVLFSQRQKSLKRYFYSILLSVSFLLSAALVYILTNPFTFLDFASFQNSISYESSVSLGTQQVFYTGEFFNKIPVLFQFLHIYPFIANPVITLLFMPAFLFFCFISVKRRNKPYILLATCYLLLFLSQAFLFTKWTRYIIPTLPFMYLLISVAMSEIWIICEKKVPVHGSKYFLSSALCLCSFICMLAYFITAFVQQDTRTQAYSFAKSHISADTQIMSETFDLGIIPFNDTYHDISLINTYDLDNGLPTISLTGFSTIILPSQRVYKTRILEPKQFPVAHQFYTRLFNGSLGYQKIYETPCDIFCHIAYGGDPVFSLEETATVFDRPTIFIFTKK